MKTKAKSVRIGSLVARRHLNSCYWWRAGCRIKTRLGMEEMFRKWGLEVPPETTWLKFTLYGSPGADRVGMRIQRSAYGDTPMIVRGRRFVWEDVHCDKRLNEYIGKKVYVEVEYLEP